MGLREELEAVYQSLPTMKKSRCHELCMSGECKFECCTITGCSPKERKNINQFLREKRLNLPFIKDRIHAGGYILPFNNPETPKCAYIGENGCRIYEVRPAICRLFGAVKQMPCSFQPEQAAHQEYPIEAMVKIGMIPESAYENGKLETFDKIMNGEKKSSLFERTL